jgi:PAS domain S-box-containing protein
MFIRYSIFFCILSILFPAVLCSETVWTSRVFKPADGLAYQVVRDIEQDANGHFWFATWGGGLSCYDGFSWRTYSTHDGLVNDFVRALAFDRSGGLWVGTAAGISFYNGVEWKNYTTQNTPILQIDSVFSILVLQDNTLLFGMNYGALYAFNPLAPEAQAWSLINDPEQFTRLHIRNIVQSDDGRIWVPALETFVLENGEWKKANLPPLLSSTKLSNGQLIGITKENVSAISDDLWRVSSFTKENTIRSMVETRDGSVFVAAREGVYIRKGNSWELLDIFHQKSRPSVECIKAFEDESIWIGTRNGVYLIRKSDWSVFHDTQSDDTGLWKRFSCGINQSPHSIHPGGDFHSFRDNAWHPAGRIPEECGIVQSLLFVSKDRITVQCIDALYELHYDTLDIRLIIPIPSQYGEYQSVRTEDGVYWLYGIEGLLFWNGHEWQPYQAEGLGVYNDVDLFLETQDRKRWLVKNDNQVFTLKDNGIWTSIVMPNISRRHITAIHTLKNGETWFATSGNGIYVLRDGIFHSYTARDGLPSDWVLSLFESANGTVWAGMDNAEMASFRDGRWISHSCHDLDLDGDVLTITEDQNNGVWFVLAYKGFARYTPSTEPPNTIIQQYTHSITMNSIGVFTFDGWDAWLNTPSEELVYSWRILDVDSDREVLAWSPYQRDRTIRTPALLSGRYRFEVRAADKDRNIDPTPAYVHFMVEPYFFIKPAFYIPIIFFMGLAAVLLIIALMKHKALRESERWLSQAQHLAHIGHWIVYIPRNVLYGSNEFFRILGISPLELNKSAQSHLHFIQTSELKIVEDVLQKAMESPQDSLSFEQVIVRPDGEERTIQVRSEIERNEEALPIRMMGTIQDITTQRHLEDESQRARKLEAIRIMAGGLAHDYNNLFTVILGNLALAKAGLKTPDKAHERLCNAENAAHRAHTLTTQLSSFSAGTRPVKKQCRITETLQLVMDAFQTTPNLDIELQTDEGLWNVEIDNQQMPQVFHNIIMNAVEAMPGGGKIEIHVTNCLLKEGDQPSLPEGSYVVVVVKDHGNGIAPEHLPKVFDPYFTTKDTVTQKGLGLGLALCFSIVKRHKGAIQVKSKVGVGSEFYIYLPARLSSISSS